jgi:hypothetical protein
MMMRVSALYSNARDKVSRSVFNTLILAPDLVPYLRQTVVRTLVMTLILQFLAQEVTSLYTFYYLRWIDGGGRDFSISQHELILMLILRYQLLIDLLREYHIGPASDHGLRRTSGCRWYFSS